MGSCILLWGVFVKWQKIQSCKLIFYWKIARYKMPSLTSAEQLQVGKRQMEFMGMWNKNGSDHLKKNVPKKIEGLSPFDHTFSQ